LAAAQRKTSRCAPKTQNIIDIFTNSIDILKNSIEIFRNINDILSLMRHIDEFDVNSGWFFGAQRLGSRCAVAEFDALRC